MFGVHGTRDHHGLCLGHDYGFDGLRETEMARRFESRDVWVAQIRGECNEFRVTVVLPGKEAVECSVQHYRD